MAFTVLAGTAASSTDFTSVTTGGVTTTGANLIVLVCGDNSTINAVTPTDSRSNTWTGLTGVASVFYGYYIRMWYCYNPSVGAAHTFSLSKVASRPAIAVIAVSGCDTSPLDQQSTGTNYGTTVQPGSITPSTANQLLVTGYNTLAVATVTGLDSSFTPYYGVTGDGANGCSVAVGYQIQTTATARNPTWTLDTTDDFVAGIASFKSAAVASTFIRDSATTHRPRLARR